MIHYNDNQSPMYSYLLWFCFKEEHSTSTVYQEPISDEVYVGDNITFTCRVQKKNEKKCEAGHRALWFREKAEDGSGPGIIYTAGDMKKHEERCEEDSDTQSCIYTLTKRSLGLSDAGVYYCAVRGCDKIMFGKGTRLELSSIHGKV